MQNHYFYETQILCGTRSLKRTYYYNMHDVKSHTLFLYLFIFNFFKYDKQIIVIYQSIITVGLAKIIDYCVIILITKISNNAKNIYFNYDYEFSIKQNYERFLFIFFFLYIRLN